MARTLIYMRLGGAAEAIREKGYNNIFHDIAQRIITCRNDLRDLRKIAQFFEDSAQVNKYCYDADILLAVAQRKLHIRDMTGFTWCINKLIHL